MLLPCRFCPVFELYLNTFSRAPRASPGTTFLRTLLFISRSFHTPPPRSWGLGTALRIYVVIARSKYFWHFQIFHPLAPPSHFTEERQIKYAVYFLRTTASTIHIFMSFRTIFYFYSSRFMFCATSLLIWTTVGIIQRCEILLALPIRFRDIFCFYLCVEISKDCS